MYTGTSNSSSPPPLLLVFFCFFVYFYDFSYVLGKLFRSRSSALKSIGSGIAADLFQTNDRWSEKERLALNDEIGRRSSSAADLAAAPVQSALSLVALQRRKRPREAPRDSRLATLKVLPLTTSTVSIAWPLPPAEARARYAADVLITERNGRGGRTTTKKSSSSRSRGAVVVNTGPLARKTIRSVVEGLVRSTIKAKAKEERDGKVVKNALDVRCARRSVCVPPPSLSLSPFFSDTLSPSPLLLSFQKLCHMVERRIIEEGRKARREQKARAKRARQAVREHQRAQRETAAALTFAEKNRAWKRQRIESGGGAGSYSFLNPSSSFGISAADEAENPIEAVVYVRTASGALSASSPARAALAAATTATPAATAAAAIAAPGVRVPAGARGGAPAAALSAPSVADAASDETETDEDILGEETESD